MEKLTGEQILEKAKESCGGEVEMFAYGYCTEIAGEVKEIRDARTGGEGEGERWSRVYHFTDHSVYIKVHGFYTSYHGTDFGDWDDAVSIVRPVEKTITVYE